jgi:hypothetical protein
MKKSLLAAVVLAFTATGCCCGLEFLLLPLCLPNSGNNVGAPDLALQQGHLVRGEAAAVVDHAIETGSQRY